ncbi:MAG: DUF2945 domain-containing protein [Nostoc sp. LLA-1]|nr:DUF2945 domain-containing protein [Cyanocohniella sp. LLY]
MTEQFNKGEHVEWNTSHCTTSGKVVKKLTSPTDINDHHVAASEDAPQYLVESDKTGKQAAHKPDALKRIHK